MTRGSGPPPDALLPPLTRRSLLTGAGGVAVAAPAIVQAQGMSKLRIMVVGAGVFGAWTAEHLRRAGHRTILIDSFGPAHSRSSSGGESRMTRAGYGKDAIYARMAAASLVEWRTLSASAGVPIFSRSGVLMFFARTEEHFTDTMRVHRELKLPTEALDRAAMQRRFPMIDFSGIEVGYFEPGFGALLARRAVQSLVNEHLTVGGLFQIAAVKPPEPAPGRLRGVFTTRGQWLEADRFVFACGPWLPKLFPALLDRKIVATRQEIFYFAPPAGDRTYQPHTMPGWADFNGGDIYYGFPELDGKGVKFAHDTHGAVVDPDTQSRQYSAAALADVTAFRDRRFPGLRGAPLIGAEVCQYENSSNGDFLIDRHPDMPNVILVGGGSGHGFKHGPEVGRLAAALTLSTGPQPEPRFTLATKGKSQNREVH